MGVILVSMQTGIPFPIAPWDATLQNGISKAIPYRHFLLLKVHAISHGNGAITMPAVSMLIAIYESL